LDSFEKTSPLPRLETPGVILALSDPIQFREVPLRDPLDTPASDRLLHPGARLGSWGTRAEAYIFRPETAYRVRPPAFEGTPMPLDDADDE
jgi:hypothetical protein